MNQTRITGPNRNPIVPDRAPLDEEEGEQNHNRNRQHEVSELRLDHFQALNRAEDRDRGDDPVAEEQRGAKDAEGHQASPRGWPCDAGGGRPAP